MKKSISIILILAAVLSLLLGCDSDKAKLAEIAGFYIAGDGTWLELEFDEASEIQHGTISINREEESCFWDYDDGTFEVITYDANQNYYHPGGYNESLGTVAIDYFGSYIEFWKTDDSAETIESAKFDPETATVFTKEQAAENGGFYIMRGDAFYPLAKAWGLSERYTKSVISAGSIHIPSVTAGETLVLFTKDSFSDVNVTPITGTGHTIPLLLKYDRFSDKIRLVDVFYYSDTYPEISDEIIVNDEEWDSLSAFHDSLFNEYGNTQEVFIEEINGVTATDDTQIIAVEDRDITGDYPLILDLENDQIVSIGYSAGSTWYDTQFVAHARYYRFDDWTENNDYSMSADITRDGYYILDTASLPSGTYILKYYKDHRWDGHGYQGQLFSID